eukprot:1136861-Pelagomonas_calceolata.AAC.15
MVPLLHTCLPCKQQAARVLEPSAKQQAAEAGGGLRLARPCVQASMLQGTLGLRTLPTCVCSNKACSALPGPQVNRSGQYV